MHVQLQSSERRRRSFGVVRALMMTLALALGLLLASNAAHSEEMPIEVTSLTSATAAPFDEHDGDALELVSACLALAGSALLLFTAFRRIAHPGTSTRLTLTKFRQLRALAPRAPSPIGGPSLHELAVVRV